jgi:hypothetical protein
VDTVQPPTVTPTVGDVTADAATLTLDMGGGATSACWAVVQMNAAGPVTRSSLTFELNLSIVVPETTQAFARFRTRRHNIGRLVSFRFASFSSFAIFHE